LKTARRATRRGTRPDGKRWKNASRRRRNAGRSTRSWPGSASWKRRGPHRTRACKRFGSRSPPCPPRRRWRNAWKPWPRRSTPARPRCARTCPRPGPRPWNCGWRRPASPLPRAWPRAGPPARPKPNACAKAGNGWCKCAMKWKPTGRKANATLRPCARKRTPWPRRSPTWNKACAPPWARPRKPCARIWMRRAKTWSPCAPPWRKPGAKSPPWNRPGNRPP
jgi:hypothetical protein